MAAIGYGVFTILKDEGIPIHMIKSVLIDILCTNEYIYDVIVNNKNGFLISPGDSISKL